MVKQFLAEFFESIVVVSSCELFDAVESVGIDFERRAACMRFGLCGARVTVSAHEVLDKGVADTEAFSEFALRALAR